MASNTFPSVMQLIKSTLLLGALSESEHAELADAPGTSSIIGVQSALLWQLHTSGNASLTGVMSLLLDDNHAGEDLGQIIAKVQDDLQYLRAVASKSSAEDGSVEFQSLDTVLRRTEKGVQAVADRVVQSSQNQVITLPPVARRAVTAKGPGNKVRSEIHNKRKQNEKHLESSYLSPGQLCLVQHMSQLVAQPTHPLTRKLLIDYYDLPSKKTSLSKAQPGISATGQILVGSTVQHLTTLPRPNRRDPLLTPPAISQKDARKGLLSLMERGLIPPAAEIVLSPPPIVPCAAQLYTPAKQHVCQKVADGPNSHLAGLKLDPVGKNLSSHETRPYSIAVPSAGKGTVSQILEDSPTLNIQSLEVPESSKFRPPQLPHLPEIKTAPAQLVIINGCLKDDTRDFVYFKKEHLKRWSQILEVLKLVVRLCRNYAIPVCTINCNRLVNLSNEYELGLKPSREDLLSIMINRTDVSEIISIPGRRYKGQDGRSAAASKIRATYLMHKTRKNYSEHWREKWAAEVLSTAWIMYSKLYLFKRRLKLVRAADLATSYQLNADMRRRWAEIQTGKRTIIHLPSQGYPERVRATIPEFQQSQNLQMGRLCDVQDPNVEVVYVSPVPLTKETLEYYKSLIAMGSSGEDAWDRVHIVTPDNVDSFKSHNMALSSVLLYSPTCMARIKHLITGKEAYIVPGVADKGDIAVASKLNLPMLASTPDISQLYSSKAGARHLLVDAAGVSTPPYIADIFSQEQLFEHLASLIANNLLVPRWLFKLSQEVKGHGFAYCDVCEYLPCYKWVVREASRYGPKWKKRWAQEHAIKRIASELPRVLTEHAQTVEPNLYPHWTDFLRHFVEEGGFIEGTPPSNSVTSIAVELLIEPSGHIKVLSTHDQICCNLYEVWGGSVPQSSVPHQQLMNAVSSVAEACKARGILGHFSIDFVTFIDPNSMAQELWCVDLDFGYSDTLALYKLMNYITGFHLDTCSGQLIHKSGEEMPPHFAVLAPHLHHTNLSLIYYSIFFQMCKAHHIGYNSTEKLGTLFSLADSRHREHMGMICIQKSLLEAIQFCSSNLSIIHQEISTSTMQGESNFKGAICELDKIIELMQINSNDQVINND